MKRATRGGPARPRWVLPILLSTLAATTAVALAAPLVDAMRGPVPILDESRPPPLRNAINDDQRQPRNYPAQPPIIPHRVDGYQVDRNFNRCLDCHAREKTAFSGAIPVSATHYVDRDGKVLDHVSTRRYFCLQCHVAQDPVAPLIGNRFQGEAVIPTAGNRP